MMEKKQIKILIVEDEEDVISILRAFLAETTNSITFDITCTDKLKLGLEVLGQIKFDIVLLDLNLPDSKKLDTLHKVHARVPEIPIVILTGMEDDLLGIKAVHEGAQDYLSKANLDKNILIRSLRYAIERQQAASALRKAHDELELRVKERTTELTLANKILHEEITERKRVEKELKRSREQLRNLATYLQAVREEERAHIAREIHDELGQSLTALKMDLSWLENKLFEDPILLTNKLKSMLNLTDETIKKVQRISSDLRPGILDDLGLAAAIEWQAEEFQLRTGLRMDLIIEPEDITLDQDRSISIFCTFQETLTNIARHSKATKVKASLREINNKIELRVTDDGIGITQKQLANSRSFGLIGMRERIHPWGGDVEITGEKDRGTKVSIIVPCSGGEH